MYDLIYLIFNVQQISRTSVLRKSRNSFSNSNKIIPFWILFFSFASFLYIFFFIYFSYTFYSHFLSCFSLFHWELELYSIMKIINSIKLKFSFYFCTKSWKNIKKGDLYKTRVIWLCNKRVDTFQVEKDKYNLILS